MEIEIVLPLIMQRFRVGPADGAKIDRQGMVLSAPNKGIPLVIQPQDGDFLSPRGIRGNMRQLVKF
jgi:hypothetical protein